MKKTLSIILTILMIVTMIPFTPIAFAAEGDITYVDDLSYVEHPGGWDNDSEEALNGIFPIGTQDEGKTEWKNGDKVTVSLASDKYDAQSATLTYDGAVWTSSDTLSYLKNETPTVTAVYTSSDTLGLGEFIFTPECTLVDNALSINFEDAIRTHSRLRIATLAGLPLTVTVTGFTPAGAEEAGEYVYTLTADDNGNAYLYGIFAVGATVSVKNGNIELVNYTFTAEDYPNGTEQDKSYALQAGLIIDGTLGGKTTATEDDVNALVEKLKGYVDSGITTIIVTGSEPALHNFYGIDTSAVSAALYYLADGRSDNPYCGTIDLILLDVTEIVDDEFNNTFALNSITLPKVTKLGDLAFYACCFIQTIAFGSVVTDVEEGGGVMFHAVGEKVGGCDLILNCGQMNSSYIPDLDTNTWKFRYENEFKSITLTHTGGEATCIAKAVCETCGEEYGEFDANKHTLVQKDAKAPTCTEIGWDAYESCTECDYTTYEVLPADPDAHDYTNHYCKRCGKAEDGYYAAGACGANGDNLNWSLDSDGVLTISGEGEMQEMFIYLDQPWKDYRRDIKEVVIEEGVTKIAEAAFYLLTNLEKVTISSMAEFEDFSYCFIGCSSLEEFIVSPANPYYCTDEYGVVFSKDKSKLIKAFDLSDVDYVIPDTVTSVAEEAFDGIKIKSIIVNIASESMFSDAEIGKLIVDCANVEAFAFAMTRIEEIVLTNKVSFIGYSAFGGAVITSAHYLGDPANLTIEANENESLTDVLHYCEHKEALAPTCTEIGWDAYEYCTACTYTTYVEKEALNHKDTLVKVNAKAPTCTEIGWDAYEYCTACDYSTYVELPAITHTDANCDYKCDYNCGYVYETLDFSDAKAITEENGRLYIDGAEAEIDGGYYLLNEGKYKLAENIFKTKYIWVAGEVNLDLNGYVWDLGECNIVVNAPFSVYDTSADKNGKITSSFFCTIDTNNENGVFSLYSGTIENNSVYEDRMAISALWASVNLYGGKVTGNGYALSTSSDYIIDKTVVLGDVVLESGEGYAQIQLCLRNYSDVKKLSMDVTDYTGESLETEVEAESTGKFDILKGVSSADEAEKYKLNIVTNYNNFHEKTEYDEATGDVNIYIAKNAFTQQPSAENCFTVDFNNPAATFQWYEVEEEIIGTYVAESFSNLFTYNFKAGDILKVSTDSDVDLAHLAIGNEYLTLTQTQKSKTIKFNADKTITVSTKMLDIEGIELEFSIIRETALDGETGKALKNPECKKSYCCKATVNGRVYNSDTVVGHEIIQVEEKAATCTETGWEAYGYCTECDYTTYKEIPASHEILQVGAKAATCTETGWEAYEYCTACTYTTYVELPENGHTPLEAVKENEVAPKCDVTGSYDLVVYCDDCGAELDRDTKTVDALKHSFTKYEVTEEAKCGVAGKEVAACDNGCGATDEKAIEALKHDIVIDEAVAPKCGETGLIQGEHCTRCDYKVEQEIVPALEHKDVDGDYKCDNGCGHEFEKPAPEEPTPDTPDEPTDSTCDHLCHKSGILGFFWKIVKFFSKLFKLNPVCECGAVHY